MIKTPPPFHNGFPIPFPPETNAQFVREFKTFKQYSEGQRIVQMLGPIAGPMGPMYMIATEREIFSVINGVLGKLCFEVHGGKDDPIGRTPDTPATDEGRKVQAGGGDADASKAAAFGGELPGGTEKSGA